MGDLDILGPPLEYCVKCREVRDTVLTSTMTAAAAVAGGLGTTPDSAWYRSLEKPSWQPPPIACPRVWTPLYAAIAHDAAGRMIEADPGSRSQLLALAGVDLAANAGWNWAFFKGQSPEGSRPTHLPFLAPTSTSLRKIPIRCVASPVE